MINISKIVILLFTLLISYINSGLLKYTWAQERLAVYEESGSSSDRLSVQNIFICPPNDINFKNNPVPERAEKFLQKIKILWDLRTGIIIIKNHQYHLKSESQDPILITDLFGPPDISFPFNYFW